MREWGRRNGSVLELRMKQEELSVIWTRTANDLEEEQEVGFAYGVAAQPVRDPGFLMGEKTSGVEKK